jgi:hypothetical protein
MDRDPHDFWPQVGRDALPRVQPPWLSGLDLVNATEHRQPCERLAARRRSLPARGGVEEWIRTTSR